MGGWKHCQILYYTQLTFKCKVSHEYGHFSRDCKKSQIESPKGNQYDQWKTRKNEGKKGHINNRKKTYNTNVPSSSVNPFRAL